MSTKAIGEHLADYLSHAVVDLATMQGRTLYDVQLGANEFKFIDYSVSISAPSIFRDVASDVYGLTAVKFRPGDVVIDIGANVGIVAIFVAKQAPGVTVYAYEPLPMSYAHLKQNILLNDVENVVAINQAVTGDGRDLTLQFDIHNIGGATAFVTRKAKNNVATVPSVTLQDVFSRHDISRCKLLKMDAEGAEHEILESSRHLFERVDHFSLEMHFNDSLAALGYTKDTAESILNPIASRLRVQSVKIPD